MNKKKFIKKIGIVFSLFDVKFNQYEVGSYLFNFLFFENDLN
jgi:hypothetical protein